MPAVEKVKLLANTSHKKSRGLTRNQKTRPFKNLVVNTILLVCVNYLVDLMPV